MQRFEDLVREIAEIAYDQPPGASDAEIAALAPRFEAEFGIPVPDAYAELLRVADGIDFNGATIYATHDDELDGDPVLGLPESNERLLRGEHSIATRLRFISETGDDLFAYDTEAGDWRTIARVTWEPYGGDAFPAFAECGDYLRHILTSNIEQWKADEEA